MFCCFICFMTSCVAWTWTRPQSVRTRTWTQLHHLIIYVRSVLSYSTYFLSVLLFDCLYSLFRQVFTVLVDLLYYKNSSGSCSDKQCIDSTQPVVISV